LVFRDKDMEEKERRQEIKRERGKERNAKDLFRFFLITSL
jgi:hypothetical protein